MHEVSTCSACTVGLNVVLVLLNVLPAFVVLLLVLVSAVQQPAPNVLLTITVLLVLLPMLQRGRPYVHALMPLSAVLSPATPHHTPTGSSQSRGLTPGLEATALCVCLVFRSWTSPSTSGLQSISGMMSWLKDRS